MKAKRHIWTRSLYVRHWWEKKLFK